MSYQIGERLESSLNESCNKLTWYRRGGCEKCIRDGMRSARSCMKEGLLEGHDDDVMSRLAARACGS